VNAPAENLCAFLRESCEKALESLPPGRAKETVTAVVERLSEEVLRVAVGGRLKAGKSTLVNSLLGEKLAATDATECTLLVSRFTYGLLSQVVIRQRGGDAVTLPGQPLSSALEASGIPAGEVTEIEVRSSNQKLAREYTLVDTPGLDSVSELDKLSMDALRKADVVIYVMPQPGEVDLQALEALRDSVSGAGLTAVSAIGVLSQVDVLGRGRDDPWEEAHRVARRYAGDFAGLVFDVIPVVGLLAETALGDQFSEDDMGPLRRLHELGVARPEDLAFALYDAEHFRSDPMPLPAEARERLLSMLGMHGVRLAIAEYGRGVRGATSMCRALRGHSGIDALLDKLKSQFTTLADPLRARWAIAELDAVAWSPANQGEAAPLARLRDDLAAAREHPRLRQFAVATSLADLKSGEWKGPDGVTTELTALTTGTTVSAQLGLPATASAEEIRARLIARITAWRVLENTVMTRAASRHAQTVREYLESLFAAQPAR
jgi:hypothetical protein